MQSATQTAPVSKTKLWAGRIISALPVLLMVFSGAFGVGYWIGGAQMRKYFIARSIRRVGLHEALSSGESEYVEFKREAEDTRSLLKDIAAFANTNGGTVFVGITDDRSVVGIPLSARQDRNKFEQRLLNSIRDSIRPAPPVEVHFEEVNGRTVAKIFVPPGDQLYSLDGRFYVRRGVESVHLVDDEIRELL